MLSDQDGHGRMFSDGLRQVLPALRRYSEAAVRMALVLTLVTAWPIALYLVIGEPVQLLRMAGAIEAAHIPVVTALTMYLNHTRLPAALQLSWPTRLMTATEALFFAAFAVYYGVRLLSSSWCPAEAGHDRRWSG